MRAVQVISFFWLIAAFSQPAIGQKAKPFTAEGKKISVYTTTEGTDLKISASDNLNFQKLAPTLDVFIYVDPQKTFQTVLGLGGAITDASAEVFAKLTKDQQDEFLKAYFDKEKGIGYTMARTNIASCDFSSDIYNYVQNGDKELKTFNIDHDKQYRIPLIKRAIQYAGGKLPMLVSPWSPPAFMKSNNDVLHGGKLLPEYDQSWANYFVKFIKAYEKEGIPISFLTVQNEPLAVQSWESCIFTAEEERDFLKNFLGPTMKNSGLGDKKIIIWDHNRDVMVPRASIVFDDPQASKYAWGIGIHWYEVFAGGETFENVRTVHENYPDKNIFFTEGCNEGYDSTKLFVWSHGERYANNMINDFNNGLVAFTDWNILLDEKGGPNHVNNFCYAPVHFNTKTGKLIYTPSYYYIGHFSKFVRPNAKRVSSSSSRLSLQTSSFINADGKVATIVLNKTDREIKYSLIVYPYSTEVTIKPHSIQTLVY